MANLIAKELNLAIKSGVNDDDLQLSIEDYFLKDEDRSESESDTGSEDGNSDSNNETPSTSTYAETTLPNEDGEEGKSLALKKAEEYYEIADVPEKSCHCHCKLFNGGSCLNQFEELERKTIRLNAMELSPSEKDMMLLGIILATVNTNDMTMRSKKTNVERKRDRIRCFHYDHKQLCREAFLYLMDIGRERLTNLKKWFKEHGLVPRRKHSGGRQKTALSFDDIKRVYDFLHNYASQHALLLPGRVPGFRRTDVKILPTSVTKVGL